MLKNNVILYKILTGLLYNRLTRKPLIRYIQKTATSSLDPGKSNRFSGTSRRIQQERKLMVLSIIESLERSVEKETVHPVVSQAVLRLWADSLITSREKDKKATAFREEMGFYPPFLLVIGPGHACNLKCADCYAGSNPSGAKLSWETLDRIISDARELWGIRLVVFSGGEPFAYRSNGKDILDIVKKNPDCLFLAFTNGTLIDIKTAERLGDCKNLTPAFSVEGMREITDARRGKGIFNRVLESMELVRNVGVPFGLSVTVNSKNCGDVLDDEFLDFFFNEQGAFYGFYFQYLPIGRDADFNLMPSPQQRLEFWHRIWDVIENKRLFLLDFWNHGPLVNGCISAGRDGGYIYIDWNGDVMPCVFAPYISGNIHELYKNGKNLNELLKEPFLATIRKWQEDYGFGKEDMSKKGNLLMSCPYRDHNPRFMEWVKKYNLETEDGSTKDTLSSDYHNKKLSEYGRELADLLDPVWEREYLEK